MIGSDIPAVLERDELRLLEALSASMGVKVYLVGGCLRDAMLGRGIKDLDFAMGGEWGELPRIFADRVRGSFFWLDEARGQCRVVRKEGLAHLTFDFAPLRGNGIAQDLLLRDFTINSMAMDIAGGALIDPLSGEKDIKGGLVRASYPAAFDDDPLRLLRAFRLAALLGFVIEENTLGLARQKSPLLTGMAPERIRDEFFQILAPPEAAPWIKALADSGILGGVFPSTILPFPALPEVLARLAELERVVAAIPACFPLLSGDIRAHMGRELEAGVNALSLLKLSALLPVDGSGVAAMAARLRLSNASRQMLARLCTDTKNISALAGGVLASRAKYRFFRDAEPAGVELAILSLVGPASSLDYSACAELLGYFFNEYAQIAGDLLLSGDEVMALLGIGQGPAVGEAMERLREAESIGEVATPEEARAFIKKNC